MLPANTADADSTGGGVDADPHAETRLAGAREGMGILLLLLVCLGLTLVIKPDADNDLWARLAVGKLTLDKGWVSYHDVFAYTPTKPLWVDHEWGSGVLFYLTASAFGEAGLLVLKALLLFGTVLFVYLTIRRRTRRSASLWFHVFLAYALFFAGFKVTVRCQAFTYFFFAMWLYLLERWRSDRTRGAWWVCPVSMIAWANLHGGFLSGLALLAVFGIGELLNRRPWKPYALLAGLCGLVTIANPYGYHYWTYLLQAATMPRPYITEWQPVNLFGPIRFLLGFRVLFMLACALLVVNRIRRAKTDWVDMLLVGLTGVMALRVIRHTPFFAISAAPFIYVSFRSAWAAATAGQGGDTTAVRRFLNRPRVLTLRHGLSHGVLLGATILAITLSPFRIVMDPSAFPSGAIDFIQANGLRGNLLVPFNWGSYALWRLFPQCRVSMDGRYEGVYEDAVFMEIYRFFEARQGWAETLTRYPPDLILVMHRTPIERKLKKAQGWRVAYGDELATLFVPAGVSRNWLSPSQRPGTARSVWP